ncbi:3-oxoacyl-(acyl-carrier-protein) reductase FabG [Alphaproteobacteria bacterium]
MFKLSNRRVLLTGSTGGIGQAILETFIKLGATVVASGTNTENLGKLCSKFGSRVVPISCNLADYEETELLVGKAVSVLGGLDILVCNAGITRDNLSVRMKQAEWDEVIKINLTATFQLNRAALKEMIKHKYGRIINISSIVGYTGNVGQVNYSAAKAGIIAMSKSLSLEFASRGVTINSVAPGFIDTAMTKDLGDTIKEAVIKRIPMGRMGTSHDIAAGVAFLASDESSYITGATLHINGGMLMC